MSNLAIKAQATGNFSAAGTWAGGVIPGPGDTAYSNSFTVTIDQAVGGAHTTGVLATALVAGVRYQITKTGTTTWTSFGASVSAVGTIFLCTGVGTGTGTATALTTLTNIVGPSGFTSTAGGGFACSSTRTITAELLQGAAAATVLTLTGTGVTFTLVGNIYGGATTTSGVDMSATASSVLSITGNIIGGSTTNGSAVYQNSSTASLTIVGAVRTISSGHALTINAFSGGTITGVVGDGAGVSRSVNILATSGTLTINGDITGSHSAGGVGVFNNSTVSLVVTGNVTGGHNNSYGINNNSTGTVSVTGNVRGGGVSASHGILATSTGVVTVVGNLYATGWGCAITSLTSTLNVLYGSQYDHVNGVVAYHGNRLKLGTAPASCTRRFALNGYSTYVSFFSADTVLAHAAAGDVRSGITYGTAGALTGTLTMPTAAQVSIGASVGTTVGTAVLTASTVRQAVAQSQ